MSDLTIRATTQLNQIANGIGRLLLSPLGSLPAFFGAVVVAIVTGILMLIAFKYTSHQSAMKKIRSGIKAELLALSLFKDSIAVSLGSQWRIVAGALKSILVSLIPIACMIVPVTLLLGQLSLWWQARPLQVGEDTVITLNLAGNEKSSWPEVDLEPSPAVQTNVGPVRIRSKRSICWNLQALEPGYHNLVFHVDGQNVEKQLAVGQHPMRTSIQRPAWNWTDVVLYPAEPPFDPKSPVKSIEIQYPPSSGWATGTQSWLIFWFIGSTIVAFCFRGVFKVTL